MTSSDVTITLRGGWRGSPLRPHDGEVPGSAWLNQSPDAHGGCGGGFPELAALSTLLAVRSLGNGVEQAAEEVEVGPGSASGARDSLCRLTRLICSSAAFLPREADVTQRTVVTVQR